MRMFRRRVEDNTVPMDMTPMIDCIFLLLIFFILTSRFVPDELQLSQLMSTKEGQHDGPPQPVISERIRIAITPAGAPARASEAELDAWTKRARRTGVFGVADLRIGGREPLRIDLDALSLPKGPGLDAQMERVHRYVADSLAELELGARTRGEAPAVEIHCFSGLPWSFAILAYDAVRAYEGQRFAARIIDHRSLADARTVNFAPPRIRSFSGLEDGKELGEIQRLR